jgi:hypothetical protein
MTNELENTRPKSFHRARATLTTDRAFRGRSAAWRRRANTAVLPRRSRRKLTINADAAGYDKGCLHRS